MNVEELRGKHCALIDGHTVDLILIERLSTAYSPGISRIDDCAKHYSEVLERLCVYDYLAFDIKAAESLGLDTTKLPDFVRPISVNDATYSDIADAINSKFASLLNPRCVDWMNDDKTSNAWFDHGDKKYADHLARLLPMTGIGSSAICDSANSSVRTYFYLQLAKHAGIPLFLSRSKRKFFKEFRGKLIPEIFPAVERAVDKIVLAKLNDFFKKYYESSFLDVELPPLAEHILRMSTDEGISPLAAVERIRKSEPASAFRKWLATLQQKLLSADRPSAFLIQNEIESLTTAITSWTEYMDLGINVKKKKRTLNLKALPTIGWIFELAGKESLEVSDPILDSQNGHLAFVAEWYGLKDQS